MKLLLCSEGFHTPNTVQACVDLVGKPQNQISFAIINEAYAIETGDKRWVLDNINDVVKNFPAEVDFVNLLALPIKEVEARIMEKDALFVVGGHTGYLTGVFKKTGFDKLLSKLLKTKVYVGSSAGSMVLGRRLSPMAVREIYGPNDKYDVPEYLALLDFSIIPHLGSKNFSGRISKLKKAAKKHKGVIYGLSDDCAVIVNDKTLTLTGTNPYVYNAK